jgi:type IV pilus assembly protein PilN
MIRINLLPPEYAEAQARKEQRFIFGSAGGVLVTLLLLFWLVKAKQASALQSDIDKSEAELAKYQAIVSQIETIEADKRQMIAKRDVIKNLNRSRLLYPVFFEDFLPIVPSDVWVTNIGFQEQGGAFKVTLSCNALSNFALATWLTNLQQSKNFSGIDLGSISYTNSDSGQTLTFPLSFKYQHQGPFPLVDN